MTSRKQLPQFAVAGPKWLRPVIGVALGAVVCAIVVLMVRDGQGGHRTAGALLVPVGVLEIVLALTFRDRGVRGGLMIAAAFAILWGLLPLLRSL